MKNFEWQVRHHTEAGYWYCEKLIFMGLPEVSDLEHDTEAEAQAEADKLNDNPPSYLHIGQHWRKYTIIAGVEWRAPAKLENIKQLESMRGTPLETSYRIDQWGGPSWGEEVYLLGPEGALTYVTAKYDTSD